MSKPSVAILGLGTMGSGMASNLIKAGFPLTVYNRTPAKAERLAAAGACVAATAAQAMQGAQVVIAMLADDGASRATWFGDTKGTQGALTAAEPSAVLLESSTVSPGWIAELHEASRARGLDLLDAPVTGSRIQAEGAELTFLVGGPEAALATVTPVLQAMGKQILHFGPSGSGARVKLVNNFLCGVQVAALAEALAWIEHSGLDRAQAINFLCGGAIGSPLLRALSTRMIDQNYQVNFLLNLMAKDLQYAQETAREAGVSLSTAATAHALFLQALSEGHGEEDMAAVVEPLRHAIQAK